jgi:hypothetical protein
MLPREWFTPRLAMRSPLLEDAEAILIGWAREPNVTRFLTWHPHEHVQRTNEFLELEKAGMSPRSPWTPACTSPTSSTSSTYWHSSKLQYGSQVVGASML